MKKHFAACLLLTPALVFSQSSTEGFIGEPSMEVQSRVSGPDVGNYVSADLDFAEQKFMRTYMSALSSDARTRILNSAPEDVNVAIIDGSTGKIHYNRPELAGSLEVQSDLPLPADPPPFLEGDDSGAIEPSANPGLFGGSGPYRRVYTTSLPAIPVPSFNPGITTWGNYEQSGWVTTYCKNGTFGAGDVGYVYLGGWSGSWNTVKGAEAISSVVDAGLQYSPTLDDYAMFMNVGGGKPPFGIIHKGNSPDSKQPFRIACGSLTHLFFTVVSTLDSIDEPSECHWDGTGHVYFGPSPACTTFGLLLEANSAHVEGEGGKNVVQFILWVAPSVDTGGWSAPFEFVGSWNGKPDQTLYASKAQCGGCIFKWMTSIGQKPKDNLTDGATFKAAWYERQITRFAYGDIYPKGQELAPLTGGLALCSEYPLWKPPYGKPYNADCKNSPTGLKGTAQSVNVTSYEPTEETDMISLTH